MGNCRYCKFDAEKCKTIKIIKVLSRVLKLREQLEAYCTEQGNQKAAKFRDILWLAKLAYLASIFDRFNEVNLIVQRKGATYFKQLARSMS